MHDYVPIIEAVPKLGDMRQPWERKAKPKSWLSDHLTGSPTRLTRWTPGCSICTGLEVEKREGRMKEGYRGCMGMKWRQKGLSIVMQAGIKWRMRLVVGIGAMQRKAGRVKRWEGGSRIRDIHDRCLSLTRELFDITVRIQSNSTQQWRQKNMCSICKLGARVIKTSFLWRRR